MFMKTELEKESTNVYTMHDVKVFDEGKVNKVDLLYQFLKVSTERDHSDRNCNT
jgi:hypothetical protein